MIRLTIGSVGIIAGAIMCIIADLQAQEGALTPMQQLAVMKEIKPATKVVGVLCNVEQNEAFIKKANRAAASLGLQVIFADVKQVKDISTQFRLLASSHDMDFLWIINVDEVVMSNLGKEYLFKNSVLNRIPISVPTRELVAEGGTFYAELEEGKIKLTINQKVAQALQLMVPEQYKATVNYVAN